MNYLSRKGLIVFGIVFCLVTALGSPALAQYSDVSGGGVVADVVVLRPLGIIATALGTVLYVAILPFTMWSGESLNTAGVYLVGEPFAYTFIRPLGAWDAP